MWSDSRHEPSEVPVLLAGGPGGTLQTGRLLDGSKRDTEERKLCSLYLSIMDRMEVKLEQLGAARSLVGL